MGSVNINISEENNDLHTEVLSFSFKEKKKIAFHRNTQFFLSSSTALPAHLREEEQQRKSTKNTRCYSTNSNLTLLFERPVNW
jgi:hypothetical protein